MKNTLSITNDCVCTCIDSVADGTNRIIAAVEVEKTVMPVFKIWKDGVLQSTIDLTAGKINYVEIVAELFSANTVITFQYSDASYTGQIFKITFPSTLSGNLSIKKDSDYIYNAKYTVPSGGGGGGGSYTLPPATKYTLGGVIVGNGLNVERSGLLSVDEAFFVSVSNGKELIASAITDKGVQTEKDATFLLMSENIKKITFAGMANSYFDMYVGDGVAGNATYE